VDILVEVAGGPDMEFACPVNLRNTVAIFNPQCGVGSRKISEVEERKALIPKIIREQPRPIDRGLSNIFTPQSGISSTSKPIVSVMDDQSVDPTIEPAMYCIGERVQSVRQMIKRFCTWYAVTVESQPTVQIGPQYNYIPTVGLTSGYLSIAGQKLDLLSYYSVLFRFWRGSTRVKIVDPVSNSMLSTQTLVWAGPTNTHAVALMPTPPIGQTDQPTVTIPSLSGGGEYEIPYYSMTHASHVTINSSTGNNFVTREAIDNQTLLQVTQQSNFSTSTRIYRAAGDDYSLGFFIGTIPLTTNNVV